MTSFDMRSMSTGRPTGMWISFALVTVSSAREATYCTSHHHWWPMTRMLGALSGSLGRGNDASVRRVRASTRPRTAAGITRPPTRQQAEDVAAYLSITGGADGDSWRGAGHDSDANERWANAVRGAATSEA